jgi:hypothetical protein
MGIRARTARYHAGVIASAYLRVFQPIDAYPEAERVAWERYVVQGEHLRPEAPVYRQRRTAPEGRLGLLTFEDDRADVRVVEGRWFVCPRRTRLRVLASLLSLRETVPSEMADALVPETETRRAARELARIRRRDPGVVPAMIESHWHVPVRWFVLFGEEERRLVERPEGGWRLYYWSDAASARRRAARAVGALREGDLASVASLVEDLDEWLSHFAGGSVVELDYGGLSDLFGWNELDEDHSAREVQRALDALEEGRPDRAAERYQHVAGRWAEARIRESLN